MRLVILLKRIFIKPSHCQIHCTNGLPDRFTLNYYYLLTYEYVSTLTKRHKPQLDK